MSFFELKGILIESEMELFNELLENLNIIFNNDSEYSFIYDNENYKFGIIVIEIYSETKISKDVIENNEFEITEIFNFSNERDDIEMIVESLNNFKLTLGHFDVFLK